MLDPAQNISWGPPNVESRPVVSCGYCAPPTRCRGVPRVQGPVLWCTVGAESRPKYAVDSREYRIPPETDSKEKNSSTRNFPGICTYDMICYDNILDITRGQSSALLFSFGSVSGGSQFSWDSTASFGRDAVSTGHDGTGFINRGIPRDVLRGI